MVLAEPRGRVPVFLQDGADGAFLDRDDEVVTREARRYFADHPVALRVMVASRDDRRPRRRAKRGGVEIRVAQPLCGDAIHGGRGYDAAEGAWCTETLVIRHDEQHVGGALRRHDTRRPPGLRLRGLLLDYPAERRIGRRKLFAGDRGGGFGRTWDPCDLLSRGRDAAKGEKSRARTQHAADFHDRKLPL